MTLYEAVEYFGSAYRLSKELGITVQNTTHWRKNGHIPMFQQFRLEKMTRGELRADKEVE
jgi:hypothetical protein